MGLLHDIGKLFLLQVVGEIEKKWQVSEPPTREEKDVNLTNNETIQKLGLTPGNIGKIQDRVKSQLSQLKESLGA